jgi:hypothetical protein
MSREVTGSVVVLTGRSSGRELQVSWRRSAAGGLLPGTSVGP